MSFEQLLAKVRHAEDALEAQERRLAADARQLKASWRAAWTPGRIVVAGLVSGFLAGRARPLRVATDGTQWVQLVSLLSGLFAGGSAQAAAGEAEAAADAAAQAAARVDPHAADPDTVDPDTVDPDTFNPDTVDADAARPEDARSAAVARAEP